jgi:hypothetical protein
MPGGRVRGSAGGAGDVVVVIPWSFFEASLKSFRACAAIIAPFRDLSSYTKFGNCSHLAETIHHKGHQEATSDHTHAAVFAQKAKTAACV